MAVEQKRNRAAANGVTRRKRVTDCRVSVAPRDGEALN